MGIAADYYCLATRAEERERLKNAERAYERVVSGWRPTGSRSKSASPDLKGNLSAKANTGRVLELRAQGEGRRAGEPAAQPEHPQQASPGRQAERVPVDDVHVDRQGGGHSRIPAVAVVVDVDQLEPRERDAGVDQGLRHLDPRRPRGGGPERIPHREADDPPEQQRREHGGEGERAGEEVDDRRRGDHGDGQGRQPLAADDVA